MRILFAAVITISFYEEICEKVVIVHYEIYNQFLQV